MRDGRVAKIEADLRQVRARVAELGGVSAATRAEAREAARPLALLASGRCSACGQVAGAELLRGLRERADALARVAEQAALAAAKVSAEVHAEEQDLEEELHEERALASAARVRVASEERLNAQARASWAASLREWEAAEGARKEHANRVAAVEAGVGEAEQALAVAVGAWEEASARAGVLGAAEQVLGLRGVRASLLGRALSGLEAAANGWLAQIAGDGLRLRLKPYAEKKTGGISDSISMEIDGAGGGYGYRAASGGERRRIDVALLLALADVAAAARGAKPGTIFCDEVFDALDDTGVEAVAAALAGLAQDRAVVVITHSAELATSLRAVCALHVAAGKVTVENHGG